MFTLISGCAMIQQQIPFLPKPQARVGGVYKENLDADRLVDLVMVKKQTGKRSAGVFSDYAYYLEVYIRGVVVDYEDNPVEGAVVRVTDKGKDLPGFDPGISDANGIYRIRFSLPVVKGKVDQRGFIAYNPPWQQQLDLLGATLEPQTKESKFRLYFDKSSGILGIGEDLPKTITRKVTAGMMQSREEKTKDEKPKKEKTAERQTESAQPAKSQDQSQPQKKNEDFFGGFGDFGK